MFEALGISGPVKFELSLDNLKDMICKELKIDKKKIKITADIVQAGHLMDCCGYEVFRGLKVEVN